MVTLTVFPFDTLKKRLQAPVDGQRLTVRKEAQTLWSEGGATRFYRGAPVKLSLNILQGACFNLVFVICRQLLESSAYFSNS